MIGNVESFFKDVWQKEPMIFRYNNNNNNNNMTSPTNPLLLDKVLNHSWNGLAELLDESKDSFLLSEHEKKGRLDQLLFFQNQIPKSLDEMKDQYDNNPFLAYLDGCSIVLNHADSILVGDDHERNLLSNICLDLCQEEIPHCFINLYVTPPNSSAVDAHADDRDVFVLQIAGEKQWKVYREVPIPYPYPHQQVGKSTHLPVPPHIFQNNNNNNNTIFDACLQPGDVLYMPRGYVHEAYTSSNAPSYHATIAVPTHDWTWSKTISDILRQRMDQTVNYRLAIPHPIGQNPSSVKDTLREIHALIQTEITQDTISNFLQQKYNHHNQMVSSQRKLSLQQKQKRQKQQTTITTIHVTGPQASKDITLNTILRASTVKEKESIVAVKEGKKPGLTVREEIGDCVVGILQKLKGDPNLSCPVSDLKSLLSSSQNDDNAIMNDDGLLLCDDFTLLCFAKCCVEFGAVSIVSDTTTNS